MIFETNDGIIMLQSSNCGYFKVFTNTLQWKIERLIWIGFYNNNKNDTCFINKLPKDIIIHYIFKFIGYDDQTMKKHSSGIAFIKTVF